MFASRPVNRSPNLTRFRPQPSVGCMRSAFVDVAAALAMLWLAVRLARRYANRSAARAILKHRARVDRFKFASRAHVRAQLLGDPVIAEAIREHAHEHGVSEAAALARVNV